MPDARDHRSDETAPATDVPETPGDYRFPAGTLIGRYALRERLGAGGYGVVYAADDTKLGRAVALKLLRPESSGRDDAQRQLLREAQTLALLAHPNVVTVHDIGEFDGRVYVDMELVKGETLARWLGAKDRSHEEILGVFVQAGRGLAAAHAVGIVHRDFKPDNVLVGDDGRVRVVDFGIALLGPQPAQAPDKLPEPSAPEPGGTTAPPVTRSNVRSGSRTGTPWYMAPEHRRDGKADARSDQYSFCVALREAVTSERRTPRGWLLEVVERGLAAAPEQRHASMEDLLDQLASRPRRRRRLAAAAGLGAAAVALLGAGVVWGHVQGGTSGVPFCRGAEAKLAGVWDDARKAQIERAFRATGKPFAADAWRGTAANIDRYASGWTSQRTDACEATRVRGEQSDQLLDLRMTCLDDRLTAMSALVEVLSTADDGVVAHAYSAAQALPALSACADSRTLLAKVKSPTDPKKAGVVAGLRSRLAQVKVLEDAGKYRDALPLAITVSDDADAAEDRGTQASAWLLRGSLLGRNGNLLGADQALHRAASLADAAGDDATRVRAWGTLLFYVVDEKKNVDRLRELREQGTAALARLGGNDDVEAEFLENLGTALQAAGQLDEAYEAGSRAVTLEVRAHGKDSWQEGIALDDLGIACAIAGKNEEALDLERRVVAIEEVELGPSHPYIASAENAMAGVLTNLGQLSAAEQHARRAVEIAEGTVNDEELARFVFDLGETLSAEKRLDDALSAYERAVVLAAKVHGGEPAMWDYFVRAGDTCRETGDATGAVPYLEGALALPEADGHADLTHVEFSLARALYDARLSPARALGLAVKARRTLAKGPQGEDTAKELAEIDAWISGKR